MQPTVAQIQKEKKRKRTAAERWQRHLADLRRRREQAERDRKKRLLWLIMIWISILESIPTQLFFPIHFAAMDTHEQKRQPQRPRKSQKKEDFDRRDDPVSDYDRHYLFDHRPRYGEEEQEVYDGLTYDDIVALNKVHRPWLLAKFEPIPGMPRRYAEEPAHVWTLLYEMQHPHARGDAIAALKLITDADAHGWIDACEKEIDGLSYKDLRRQCMRRTPDATLFEFPRAAARWREEQRREAEERKLEAKETSSTPKPTGTN